MGQEPGHDIDYAALFAGGLYARTEEPQVLGERPEPADARERTVAVSLQRSMLPPDSFAWHPDVAARYLPAVCTVNVCGDWYELVDLGADRLAVAVGDVVGHGLGAAGVMGRLRGALSSAVRDGDGPARALEVLGRYAAMVEGALATTVVQTVVDRAGRTIAYSCAGHPPPVLTRPGGAAVLLDGATDPPLGVQPRDRPEARVAYEPGATLVLYTDGLVERRGEDIDVGLRRLTDGLARNATLGPEPLADALLDDLGVAGGAADDVALVVLRL